MSTLKNAAQVADILGCKKTTVYRLVRNGKIPHRKIGALTKFTDSDIQSYIESTRAGAEGKNE